MLLLRGPQTPGELRSRTDRMYHFEALDDIVSTLDRLAQRDPPLARVLPRQPGTKESRYMHLFSGEPPIPGPTGAAMWRGRIRPRMPAQVPSPIVSQC